VCDDQVSQEFRRLVLPDNICSSEKDSNRDSQKPWFTVYGNSNHKIIGASAEANGRAKMLIYLIENKLITI
jgi:hypothetical protein